MGSSYGHEKGTSMNLPFGPTATSPFLTNLVYTFCTITFLLASFIGYRIFFHPLAKFPGPLQAKYTGWWRSKRYFRGSWHDDILLLHEKYGRVVRIAPNELSIVDEGAIKSLYGHGTKASKTSWYETWQPPTGVPALFSTQDKEIHSFLRKRTSGAYSMSAIMKYEEHIQGCLNVFLAKLRAYGTSGTELDMSSWSNALALDAIGELAYGEHFGHLETETDVMDLHKNLYTGFQLMSTLGHFPFQTRWIQNQFVKKLITALGAKDVLGEFDNWTINRVKDRLAAVEKDRRDDMLAHFCQMKGADGKPASLEEIMTEALQLVYVSFPMCRIVALLTRTYSGAGADTTSIAMRSCLYYICTRADVYQVLQKEIDKFYHDNALREPITYQQCREIPYLVAVVKEATRLLPSITFQLLRHAPPDFVVDGNAIPAGTSVGVSALAQNRDKAIWGLDANEFRPERWLESEARAKYLESNDMTFGGSGPRMCIGRNIALVGDYNAFTQSTIDIWPRLNCISSLLRWSELSSSSSLIKNALGRSSLTGLCTSMTLS